MTTVFLATAPDSAWNLKSGEELAWVVLLMLVALGTLLILGATIYLALVLKRALEPTTTEAPTPKPPLWQRLTGLRPMSHERELVMDHAYDGIVELNNPTPPWFMALFYGTIAFGLVYLVAYHVIGTGDVMAQEYRQEVAVAEQQREAYLKRVAGKINETNVTFLTDAKEIETGKALYGTYCTACHGAKGEGVVGPNLTDSYWLHGGTMKAVFHTIMEGVPDKGMVSWKKQLNPLQIQQVASYILSLQGSNPPSAKAPQGDKVAAN